ncbi:MAG: hypothetical protein P8Y53_08645 [Pseudolabrys sp.]
MLRASDGLVDLLPIATFICDAGGAILQYNGRAVEIWGGAPEPGWTHDEFTRNCSFFTLDARPAAYSMVSEVLMSRTPVRDVERVLERADGTRVVVLSISIRFATPTARWSARSTTSSTSPSASASPPRSSIRAGDKAGGSEAAR